MTADPTPCEHKEIGTNMAGQKFCEKCHYTFDPTPGSRAAKAHYGDGHEKGCSPACAIEISLIETEIRAAEEAAAQRQFHTFLASPAMKEIVKEAVLAEREKPCSRCGHVE